MVDWILPTAAAIKASDQKMFSSTVLLPLAVLGGA
jgi:hypothetical protein